MNKKSEQVYATYSDFFVYGDFDIKNIILM